jgi:N-acetylneuraminic acid mutarotase
MSDEIAIKWSERQPMLQSQVGGAAAYFNGQLVIAGGTAWDGDTKVWLSDVQIYDPTSNRWSHGPKLPVPLAYGPFVYSAAGIEILGGMDGNAVHRDSWKLVSTTGTWERSGSVPADTLLGRAARVGDSVFLFGGCPDAADLTRCSDAVWRRDGNGEWRRESSIPGGPLALPAIAVSGPFIYLFGGCSMRADGKVVNHTAAHRYDTGTNQWTHVRDLPAGNRGLSAVAMHDDFIYVLGGYTDLGFSPDVLFYDVRKNTYRRVNPMPMALMGIEFVSNGSRIYGAGGEDRIRGRSARLFEGTLPVTKQ